MFQSVAIDIAIGLVLMYLVLSLVCTVINEFIATKLAWRAKSLAAGLQALLDDPTVRNAFYDHGLISGTKEALHDSSRMLRRSIVPFATLPTSAATPAKPAAIPEQDSQAQNPQVVAGAPDVTRPPAPTASGPGAAATAALPPTTPANAPDSDKQPGDHPSYLSAETFVNAVIGCLTGTSVAQGEKTPTFDDIKAVIEKLPASNIKSALLVHLVTAEGNFTAFRQEVASWFDDSMERLSGVYKRHLKLLSIIMGCAIAVIVNADTFSVGFALWSTPSLRDQMVTVANETVKKGLPTTENPSPTDVAKAFGNANAALRPILPIGWPVTPAADVNLWWFWLTKISGWFVTGLALSLGAPFWFDLLGKFMNIRGAGPKPDRADAIKA
jgi:hypothetical protein